MRRHGVRAQQLRCECAYPFTPQVQGTWPAELRGTYLLSSPALTSLWGHSVRSRSDADGMLTSISIQGGRVFFRSARVHGRGRGGGRGAVRPRPLGAGMMR